MYIYIYVCTRERVACVHTHTAVTREESVGCGGEGGTETRRGG